MGDSDNLPALTSFGNVWVMAGVRRNPKEHSVRNPELLVERIQAVAKNSTVQVFNPSPVISLKQIHVAAVSAYLAFKAGVNIARKLEIEFLLRLSADTQIDEALDKMGVKPELNEVGLCVISELRESALDAYSRASSIIGGVEVEENELRSSERIMKALKFYGLEDKIDVVQAESKEEAALLLILERISTLGIER